MCLIVILGLAGKINDIERKKKQVQQTLSLNEAEYIQESGSKEQCSDGGLLPGHCGQHAHYCVPSLVPVILFILHTIQSGKQVAGAGFRGPLLICLLNLTLTVKSASYTS